MYSVTCRNCRGITERIPHVVLNGDPERRYVGNLNFSFAYVEGESLLMVSPVPVRCVPRLSVV